MNTAREQSFGALTRMYRLRAGMTQEQLAERAEITSRGLMYLERDKRHPQPSTSRRLADALGLLDQERRDFLHPVSVTRPRNLPDEPTPFIGRAREVVEIATMFRTPQVRLVTLTGTGGTGKTRLALRAAATLVDDFEDGIYFVNLAPLIDPALVPQKIAEVLGVREAAGQDLTQTISRALQGKRVLLVLDNYEHLLEAISVVSFLLDSCSDLHLLATSRIPLHLSREHEYPVAPLPVPDPRRMPPLDVLPQYASVALFAERARAVLPQFALTNVNASAVAEICVRLDGLPLAIELAAARLKLFSPNALVQRLDYALPLLIGGAMDRPTRQQTLRATMDWSYLLLTGEESLLFARLSVFAGSCTLNAAEAVCNADGDVDLLEGVASLVDKSLLRQEGGMEARFSMLATIREYAAERLADTGQLETIQATHAEFFWDVVRDLEMKLVGPDQIETMRWLDEELENIRAALSWLINNGRGHVAMRLASTLWRYWDSRALFEEGRQWLTAALDATGGTDPDGKALGRIALLFSRQGNLHEARRLLEQSLAQGQALGNEMCIAASWSSLGTILAALGDHDEARTLHERSLALRRTLADGRFVAHSLNGLGGLLIDQDRFVEARAHLEEGLALAREAGDIWAVGEMLGKLGIAMLGQGDVDTASPLFDESIRVLRDLGERGDAVEGLWGMMAVAGIQCQAIRAARLAGAVDNLAVLYGWRPNLAQTVAHLVTVRSSLGEEAWEREYAIGHTMNMDEAVAYTLGEFELPA